MSGGLTLLGGSAGLPFCLDTLLASYRAESRAHAPAWIWREAIGRLSANAGEWAATGVVTASGRVKAVKIEEKLRAVTQIRDIRWMLTPVQRIGHGGATMFAGAGPSMHKPAEPPSSTTARRGPIGFAAEIRPLRIAQCRSVADALYRASGMRSVPQVCINVLALAVSIVLAIALP
jgi:hypothetical protein